MKRYLAFGGQRFYPSQGLGDLIDTFDDYDDALACVTKYLVDEDIYPWVEIYDTRAENYKQPIYEDSRDD